MNLDDFKAQVDRAQDRIRQFGDGQARSPEAFSTAVTELNTFGEELRVAEEELRAQNEQLIESRHQIESERLRYKALFDLCPDAYIVTGPDGAIREANLAAGQMLSTEPQNLVGKPLAVFVPEQDRRIFRDRVDSTLAAAEPARFEMTLIPRVMKRPIPVRVTAAASGAGSGALIRWLITDLSEVHKLTRTVKALDEDMWMRVGERTAELVGENEHLKAELDKARNELTARAGRDGKPAR